MWFYNSELLPNGCGIDSWWDLTKPEYKGKIIMPELLTNTSYIAILTSFAEHADLFEKDYERVFGEKIKYTCGKENAAYELVYRLLNNDPVFVSDADEAAEAAGAPGAKEVVFGWAPSSKLRNNQNKGWHLAPIMTKPGICPPKYHYLLIMDNCDHPNAAKLLARYLAGDTNGDSNGLKQFNLLGGWSIRDDVENAEGTIPLSELPLFASNPAFVYSETPDMEDFIMKIVTK